MECESAKRAADDHKGAVILEPAEDYAAAAEAWALSHGGSRSHAAAMSELDGAAIAVASGRVAALRKELAAATLHMTHLMQAAASGEYPSSAAAAEWEGWNLPPGDADKLAAAERESRRCQTDRRAGFPHYFGLKWMDWIGFSDVHLNNIGPPEEIANACPRNTKRFEVEALSMIASALGASFPETVEGYVCGNGSTEANLWALWLARERLSPGDQCAVDDPLLLYSEQIHYSVPKVARILRFRSQMVPVNSEGQMDIGELRKIVSGMPAGVGVAVCCAIGTTFLGAIDDLPAVKEVLEELRPGRHVVHADAALFGLTLPYLAVEDGASRCDFTSGADSIAISGQKALGVVMPCGIALARRSLSAAIAHVSIEYAKVQKDTTIAGMRNGHHVVALWGVIRRVMHEGRWERMCHRFLEQARHAELKFAAVGLNPFRAKGSFIVVFDRPAQWVVDKWELMCMVCNCCLLLLAACGLLLADED